MKALLVSQSQDGSYVNLINKAVRMNNGTLTVITGKVQDIAYDVKVVEGPQYDSTSFCSRLITWFAYINFAKKYLKQHIAEYDIVLFTSNPPVNQSLVRLVSKTKKCIYLVWDIYPDTIEKVFGKKTALIAYFWRRVNHRIYRRCDVVLTIGKYMKQGLLKSYPDLDIQIIPYHSDTEFIHPISKLENDFIKENNLAGKKVFMYSGKMGVGHGFSEILEAAKQLKSRTDIQFVLIGFGSSFEAIKLEVEKKGLYNVLLLPYQPYKRLPYTLGGADVSFITIKKETDGLFLPSKVYDAIASKSAIILISAGNNDVAEMVEKEHIGIQVKTGHVDILKAAILKLADDKDYLSYCQENARKLAVDRYSIAKVTDAYVKLFRSVMDR